MDMKRFFLYVIVIAALALAGCGGNGGGGSMAGGGDMSCPAGQTGTPPNCVTPTPPTCLEDPDAANCTGLSQAQIDANTKAAGTKETAIAREAAQTGGGSAGTDGVGGADAGLGGSGSGGTAIPTTGQGSYTLDIKRDRDATTVMITVEGATDENDEKFVQAMDLGDGTTMHTRTMDADDDGNVVEEVVIVTTNIAAPRAVEFVKFEAMDGTNPQVLDVRKDGESVTINNPADSLNIDSAAESAMMRAMMFSLGSGTGVVNFDGDDTATTDMDEADEVMGYYNGASGTFRCNAAGGCSVTLADGKVTESTGWIFTPDSGATSYQQDYDYLSYGFWLKKTTDGDGVLTYNEVETFANSSIPASGATTAVTGSAIYNGGATGVYVKNVTSSAGVIESATSGHFTATATLTATFGQTVDDASTTTVDEAGQIAPNMLNTLTGSIRGYQLSGGEENTWVTVLDGTITPSDGTASGTAEGGKPGSDYDGSFSATFHGSVAPVDGTAPKPTSVVGEFNSFFTDGSVSGALGATR